MTYSLRHLITPWAFLAGESLPRRDGKGQGTAPHNLSRAAVCLGLDHFRSIEIVTLANFVKRGGVCRVKRSGYQKGLHLRRDCLSPKVNPGPISRTIVALSTALGCLPASKRGDEEQMKIFTEGVMLIIASRWAVGLEPSARGLNLVA